MQSDNIKDTGRYIVNQLHYDSICPGNRSEMWRNIYLDDGAVIKGGIFGNNLTVLKAGVVVEQSVYVRGEIKIRLDADEPTKDITFESTVATPDSMIVEGHNSKLRFNSDLYVNKLNISNTIVYGNVFCTSAIIKNSIVLGSIYAKQRLSLENSIVYSFDTDELTLNQGVSLLSPFGIAKKPFELKHPVRALTFFDIKDELIADSIAVTLDEGDVFELKISPEPVHHNQNKRYLLSIVERVLNTSDIINSFKRNREMIDFLRLQTHLDKAYITQMKELKKNDVEQYLWTIIDKKIKSSEVENRKSLREIIEKIFS